MTIEIAGAAWRCGSLWLSSGSWLKSYWLIVDYKVRIPAGLVIEVGGQNGMMGIGFPPPPIDIRWTLTNTNPATPLPPITGSRPDFSFGEQAKVIVGIPAAEAAAGTPLIKLP